MQSTVNHFLKLISYKRIELKTVEVLYATDKEKNQSYVELVSELILLALH